MLGTPWAVARGRPNQAHVSFPPNVGVTTMCLLGASSVGTLKDKYIHKVPLSWAPRIQCASHVTSNVMARDDTCYLVTVPHIPTWSDLVRSLPGFSRSTLYPFPCIG